MDGDSPIDPLLSSVRALVFAIDRRQGLEDGLDESAEYHGHGGNGDVAVFALIKAVEIFRESVLSLEGDGDNQH